MVPKGAYPAVRKYAPTRNLSCLRVLGSLVAAAVPSVFAGTPPQPLESRMEIERINLIGTRLADLSARTAALRGYL